MHRDDQKLQIQQATDIVRLIGQEILLRSRGREFVGLCPFHDDKKPSLHVSPTKQIYKCFSCGAGGDVFAFVMNYHRMTFPEAMAFLAEAAGIKLSRGPSCEAVRGQSQSDDDRQLIAQANQLAVAFFRAALAHAQTGLAARRYVQERGMSDEMVEAFQIGCAPDQWDGLVTRIRQEGWARRGFDLAGLTTTRGNAPDGYDRFRHRLIFPILDTLGRPIAFGGRSLRDQDDPKYLNSAESQWFDKSVTLYGLHLAKKAIIDARSAIVVEGYTDVIACHQAGITNAVATLGTAFTRGHAAVLSRLCDRVVLVFDADSAGQKAADRAVDVFLAGSIDVGVVVLPDGQDPAQLLGQPNGVEQMQQLFASAADALGYKLSRMEDELGQSDTVSGRERIGQRYLSDLVGLGVLGQGTIRRAMVIGQVAQLLGVSQGAVESQLRRLSAASTTRRWGTSGPPGTSAPQEPGGDIFQSGVVWASGAHRIRALELAQRQVIGCLIRQPDLFHQTLPDGKTLDEALTPSEMLTPSSARLYAIIHERLSSGGRLDLRGLLADLAVGGDQEMANLAIQAESEAQEHSGDDGQRLQTQLREAVQWLLGYHKEERYQRDRRAVVDAGGGDRRAMSDSRLNELVEFRRDHPSAVRIARLDAKA